MIREVKEGLNLGRFRRYRRSRRRDRKRKRIRGY